MQTDKPFDDEFIASVVEHMNDDHGNACLAMVRAFSDRKDASNVSMLSIDKQAMEFLVEKDVVRVPFTKPLERENQIRGHLVAMSKQARLQLAENATHDSLQKPER